MDKRIMRVTLFVLAAIFPAGFAAACSTFSFVSAGRTYVGQNYDWQIDEGYVLVNPRGVAKKALTLETPAAWVSRHGSVTFNQYGREFPNGGMNEAGLVVEVMWMSETRYPDRDERPAVNSSQWVQYVLDTCDTVADVLATDAKLRVEAGFNSPKLHYLVTEASGRSAAVEWLDGRRVVHTGEKLPVPALTNSPYTESLEMAGLAPGGGAKPTPLQLVNSRVRFTRLAGSLALATPMPPARAVDWAFGLLDGVRMTALTKWTIVYDVQGRVLHFRSQRAPAVKTLAFRDLDFACGKTQKSLDINTSQAGDAAKCLTDYTLEANRALVRQSFARTSFLTNLPAFLVELVAQYPLTLTCAETAR
ncbi:MAG: linear amide C-N hydrolase [Acidobacteria bacterium]|nr:linear amide C-N hydrolase [Acidobacteriota bacterium]